MSFSKQPGRFLRFFKILFLERWLTYILSNKNNDIFGLRSHNPLISRSYNRNIINQIHISWTIVERTQHIPSYVQHGSSLALFADDSKLYWSIDSVSSPALLQSDLDGLHSWSSDHTMRFNSTKCKVLRMSRSRRKPLNTYYLGKEVLSYSPETSDSGIYTSGNCTWNSHIEQMCAKANRVLGLVKRLCGRDIRDVQTRKLLYTVLVRPLLEYSSSVWSPYLVKRCRLIENIQRRAT